MPTDPSDPLGILRALRDMALTPLGEQRKAELDREFQAKMRAANDIWGETPMGTDLYIMGILGRAPAEIVEIVGWLPRDIQQQIRQAISGLFEAGYIS